MLAAEPPFNLDPTADSGVGELLTTAHAEALVGLLDEPVASRLQMYAYFLGSDEKRTEALIKTKIPEPLYPLCLVLRYLIVKEQHRLGESSVRFNWSLKQLYAAVASGFLAYTIHETLKADTSLTSVPKNLSFPDPLSVEPTTRDIHLQSSIQLTLHSAYQLAQSLLLCPTPFSAPPSALVLGSLFHTIAQSTDETTRDSIAAASSEVENAMLNWILDDTEQHLAIDVEALRKAKRERKKEEKKLQTAAVEAEKKRVATAKQSAVRSGFSLLQLDDDDDEEEEESKDEE
ncbi:uncharacterized protein UTRI_00057 [Ustilago trichophora]|uniref:Uncharacterized protein n=1 Tax=Ustilago trichophora TaxID=86804 RepID=A0A5C3DTS3_9BASI|nr:uncharacterized protein UTRI_00057 [Ustilago trichophora]